MDLSEDESELTTHRIWSPSISSVLKNANLPQQIEELNKHLTTVEKKHEIFILHDEEESEQSIMASMHSLHNRLEELLKKKSAGIIYKYQNNRIGTTSSKLLVYNTMARTEGLTTEIEILEKYLSSLTKMRCVIDDKIPHCVYFQSFDERKKQLTERIKRTFEDLKAEFVRILNELEND